MPDECSHTEGIIRALYIPSRTLKDASPSLFLQRLYKDGVTLFGHGIPVSKCPQCAVWSAAGFGDIIAYDRKQYCEYMEKRDHKISACINGCNHGQLRLRLESKDTCRRYVYGDDSICDLMIKITTIQECLECKAMLVCQSDFHQRPEGRAAWGGIFDAMIFPPEIFEYLLYIFKIPDSEIHNIPIMKSEEDWYMPRD